MTKRSITLTLTDADGLAENTEPCFVVLAVTRQEIESGNCSKALERLLALIDREESVHLYRESLLLQVHGYDHDPRELPEIPAVRAYFAQLSSMWPHWLWFLCRSMGAVSLLMSLLCQVRVHRAQGQFGIEFIDHTDLCVVLADLCQRSGCLCEAFNIPLIEFESSVASAMECLPEI